MSHTQSFSVGQIPIVDLRQLRGYCNYTTVALDHRRFPKCFPGIWIDLLFLTEVTSKLPAGGNLLTLQLLFYGNCHTAMMLLLVNLLDAASTERTTVSSWTQGQRFIYFASFLSLPNIITRYSLNLATVM